MHSEPFEDLREELYRFQREQRLRLYGGNDLVCLKEQNWGSDRKLVEEEVREVG